MNRHGVTVAVVVGCVIVGHAAGQSLFLRGEPAGAGAPGEAGEYSPLRGASLMYVEAPKAREYRAHDIITIIVDEVSKQSSQQTLDTKKDYNLKNSLNQFPSLPQLLQFELVNGIGTPVEVDVNSHNKFKGEGTYDRSDRFTARISATIIDVKPNGTLVLEARKSRTTDEEVQTIVLSGTCRQEDITSSNTILSSQIADMTLVQHNDGEVKNTATKGLIPRILEAIFNF